MMPLWPGRDTPILAFTLEVITRADHARLRLLSGSKIRSSHQSSTSYECAEVTGHIQ